MNVRIKENAWVAKIAARKLGSRRLAMVIGQTIYLHRVSRSQFLANTAWVCHELKHVHQYRTYGFTRFLIYYTIESIRNGYYNNKFEKEARECEADRNLLEAVNFI